jgi:hypothetical protein
MSNPTRIAWTNRLEGSKGKSVEAKRVSPKVRNKGGDFKKRMRELEKSVLAGGPGVGG